MYTFIVKTYTLASSLTNSRDSAGDVVAVSKLRLKKEVALKWISEARVKWSVIPFWCCFIGWNMFYALCATAQNPTKKSMKIMFRISQALSFFDDDFLAVSINYYIDVRPNVFRADSQFSSAILNASFFILLYVAFIYVCTEYSICRRW